jgi:hydroxymethylglutaryl-CoA lyase
VPTARKIEWIRDAHAAGQREIEVGSFVPAKLLPQLADTAELVAYAKTLPGCSSRCWCPTSRAPSAPLEAKADLLLVPLSASHAHSLANLRKTPDDVVAEVARIRAMRDAAGSKTLIEGGVGTAFGCTLQGRVEPDECCAACRRCWMPGRTGSASPTPSATPIRAPCARCSSAPRHRRRQALVRTLPRHARPGPRERLRRAGNRRRPLRRHAGRHRRLPACAGASGNVASEDLAFMLESMGIGTGIDIPRLLALREKVAGWLADETLHGTLWRAGLPKTFGRRLKRSTP